MYSHFLCNRRNCSIRYEGNHGLRLGHRSHCWDWCVIWIGLSTISTLVIDIRQGVPLVVRQ